MSDNAALRRSRIRREPGKGDDRITDQDAPDRQSQSPSDRLDGWKRIAAYLGKDVRTLRRWEKNEGLPIHRLMHDKQGTVYAFRSELEVWRKNRKEASPSGKPTSDREVAPVVRRHWIWIAVSVVIIVAAVILWPGSQPVTGYGDKDWVLITEFDNRTGEPHLDGTLEYAMERELSNSRHVRVLPRFRINDVLELMQLPPETRIDSEIGREISLRDGDVSFLINGRVEKLGDAFTLYSDLVTPEDGVIQSSYVTEVENSTGILPGIRDLASQLREALGEEAGSIRQSEAELATVTTPSLEALKLYSQANTMMMGIDRKSAVPVLRQAVRIDPDFASAHLLLWYVLKDQDQMEQAMIHLQTAVELAENTAERERLFILATYYQYYLEDIPRAIETYELLARLYPDHFWAISNLAVLNEMHGHHERAYPYQLRRADLRTNLGWEMLEAARAAAIYADNDIQANYAAKARVLAEREPWLAAHLDLLPYQTLWLDGDYRSLLENLDRLTATPGWDDIDEDATRHHMVRSLYLSLGRLETFRNLSRSEAGGAWIQALVASDGGDPEALRIHLDLAPTTFWTATLLAATGRADEARKMLNDPEAAQNTPRPFALRYWKNLAVGELALAEQRYDDAISVLSESILNVRFRSKRHYLFGAHSLARAYVANGQVEEAIATLEQARREKQWSIFEFAATYLWFRSQLYLMELYGQTGRYENANDVADELRDMLVLADENYPIRTRLDNRSTNNEG